MPPPIDPTADFLAVYADEIVTVSVQVYQPASDSHASGVNVRAITTPGKVTTVPVGGEGETRVTRTEYWLLAADLSNVRPTLQSLIADGGQTWAIDSVETEPLGAVYRCNATLT